MPSAPVDAGFTLHVSWRGRTDVISLASANPSLRELGLAIEEQLGASMETQKLLIPGHKGPITPFHGQELHVRDTGIADGCKLMLVASSAADVERVRTSRDATGIRGFDDELKRAARRRRTASSAATLQPPKGEYTFGEYQAWERPGLQPPPAEAIKLLYRLANDPGILGVMAAHRYKVGVLSEMPPEGKVGVSPVCILGVNINTGQEISLRLRTDDLKGFRKYERIRETLIHELAHMEYGEHDNNFKHLNSQLGRECEAMNARYSAGRSLLGDSGFGPHAVDGLSAASELDAAWLLESENDVMTATARLSGRTLRQLAGPASPSASAASSAGGRAGAGAARQPPLLLPARAAAAAAALSRVATAQVDTATFAAPSTTLGAGQPALENARATASVSSAGTKLVIHDAAAVVADKAGVSGASSSEEEAGEGAAGESDDMRRFEHFDAATDKAEEEARRLGSTEHEGPRPQDGDAGLTSHSGGGKNFNGPVATAGPGAPAAASSSGAGISHPVQAGSAECPASELGADLMEVDGQPAGAAVDGTAPPATTPPALYPDLPSLTTPGEAAPAATACDGGDTVTQPSAAVGAAAEAVAAAPGPRHASVTPPPLRLAVTPPSELYASAGGGSGADGPEGAAGAAAAGAGIAGGGTEDVVRRKARQAWDAVAQLVGAANAAAGSPAPSSPASAPSAGTQHPGAAPSAAPAAPATSADDVITALDTLRTMLDNAAAFREERYRRVRLGNAAFQRRVGRLPGGLALLRVAGFVEEAEGAASGAGAAEAVLRLRRDDPGLLWLVLSVVKEAREQVAAQVAAASRNGT